MPYVTPNVRKLLDGGCAPADVGQLTYVLYKACLRYIDNPRGYRYQDLAEVLGSLEATQQEFYRRIVVPYEEQKIKDNGDIPLNTS